MGEISDGAVRCHASPCSLIPPLLVPIRSLASGSTAVVISRPLLGTLGVEGSWRDGPWSYRFGYLAVMTPAYSAVLITLGTIAGRHAYFRNEIGRAHV